MLKYKPENDPIATKGLPDATAGEHRMKINAFRAGVETAKWKGDIVEFSDGKCQICEFISEETTWKFGRLARAIGDEAVNHYKQTDRDGFSMFNPKEWLGREVSVTVEEAPRNGEMATRIKKVEALWDTENCGEDESVKNDDPFKNSKLGPLGEQGILSNPSQSKTKAPATEDIPF